MRGVSVQNNQFADFMSTYPQGAIKGSPGTRGLRERLKCVREMRHMTQSDLAKKMNLQPAEVSHWETGQRLPGAENLRNLCIALNCSADYLLDCHE